MAIIADDTHAVDSSTVCVVTKAEALQPPPFESVWFITVQAATGVGQVLRFDSADARDGFYKELVSAMEKG